MDIPSLSVALAAQKTASSVSIALIKMAKETMEQQSSEVLDLLSSATPEIHPDSSFLDISI